MVNKYFVPSIAISGLDSLIEKYGGNCDLLLSEAGIDPIIFTRPDLPVDGQQVIDAIEKLARKLKHRYLGLELAEIQGGTVIGPLWFLLRNSASIKESIENLVLNYPGHTDVSFFSIESSRDGLVLSYDINPNIKGNHTQAIDLGLGILSLSFRGYIGESWRPKSIYLKVAEPYELAPYVGVFGENIHFNQESNGILLTREELELPVKAASRLRQKYFEHERLIDSDFNPRSTLVKVEHIIHSSLTRHKCSLKFAARCLDMKPRTLQYHLRQQNTTFKVLLNKAKLNLALRYLQHSELSITEISQRLHFSDSAVFTRFIARHTGKTPKLYRSTGLPIVRESRDIGLPHQH